jgi:pimeloyl-ACP methyl ester carboxylesterase
MPYKEHNKHRFYYEELGKGTPILFIHGLGSSTKDWENQLAYFSKRYKTIAVDMRGHGGTKGSDAAYSIEQFALDVVPFLEIEKQAVHIVGLSMGGLIAFQLAVNHSEFVKSLTIINSFVALPLDNRKISNGVRLRKMIPKILGMKIMGKILGKKLFPNKNQQDLRELIANRWAKNKVKDYIKSVNAAAGWSIKDRLADIECPTLIVGAEYDYTSIEEKVAYTKLIPNAKLVIIPDSHHAVSVEKPNELNTVIATFLKNTI